MNRPADLSLEDFKRLPGLYRRWELTEICEPNRSYQIEDAGTHADGTPLLAIYVSDRTPAPTAAIPEALFAEGDRRRSVLGTFAGGLGGC